MNLIKRVMAGAGLLGASAASFAVDPTTLAELTGQIDFATAATATLAMGGIIVVFKVVKQGVLIVLSLVGKAK